MLLALDTSVGEVDAKEVLAARLGVSGEMLRLVARRFAETGGVLATISRKKRDLPPVPSPVTAEVEAAQRPSCWSWTTSGTHGVASLCEAFEPGEAFTLAQRLEIHHTPKHGSWLNIAEIELSALTRQCLDRRISDLDTLNTQLAAWQDVINAERRQVRWQFTADDARIKLRHLYPQS